MEKAGSVCAEIDEMVCLINSAFDDKGLGYCCTYDHDHVGGRIDKDEFGSEQAKR